MGERGVLGVRVQPNHPRDDLGGILLSAVDGLLFGCGDAVIGVNPVAESVEATSAILRALDRLIEAYGIPTQACCLAHISTQLEAMEQGAPVDLLFQSVAGTEAANASFGISLGDAPRGARAGPRASPGARRGLGRRSGDVLRDGAGECPLGRGAPRRRPAHAGGPRVRRGAGVRPVPGQQRGRLHRAGIPRRRAADHPRGAGRPLHGQAARPADGGRRLLHQPRRRRPELGRQPA